MARYFGGPLDGRDFRTRYDHLPIIDFPWPDTEMQMPETVESYELRNSCRYHIRSRLYPAPGYPNQPKEAGRDE